MNFGKGTEQYASTVADKRFDNLVFVTEMSNSSMRRLLVSKDVIVEIEESSQ